MISRVKVEVLVEVEHGRNGRDPLSRADVEAAALDLVQFMLSNEPGRTGVSVSTASHFAIAKRTRLAHNNKEVRS